MAKFYTLNANSDVALEGDVDSAKAELNARIDLIEATSRPNMNIVGSPTFREGNVSGFSANDYLVFPTSVSVGQNTVEFHMAFHTGSDVNTQQNIMDSWCGLAFAIRNGTTVTAISTNGTSFLAESTGGTIRANNSYRLKMLFSYEDGAYRTRVFIADGAGDFAEVGTGFTADAPLFATATYWGGANPGHAAHVFRGIINLNECRMLFNGVEVWRGYDELPTVKFDPNAEDPLSTAEKIVKVVEDAVSRDNRFLVGGSYSEAPAEGSPTTAAIQTHDAETDKWTDEIRIDKGYDAVQGEAMVKLDKSVQKITVASSSLSIVLPEETQGTVRDLCLYVNNNSGADCALVFPAGTYYGDNPNGAVAKDGGVTAVYITEMPVDSWMLRISELEQFTVEATT